MKEETKRAIFEILDLVDYKPTAILITDGEIICKTFHSDYDYHVDSIEILNLLKEREDLREDVSRLKRVKKTLESDISKFKKLASKLAS